MPLAAEAAAAGMGSVAVDTAAAARVAARAAARPAVAPTAAVHLVALAAEPRGFVAPVVGRVAALSEVGAKVSVTAEDEVGWEGARPEAGAKAVELTEAAVAAVKLEAEDQAESKFCARIRS